MSGDTGHHDHWRPSRSYNPDAHGVGIVHIGAGAFHRAHQAVYTDDVLANGGGDWRILGVSLRSGDTAHALQSQGGRYHLVIRPDRGDTSEYRVIGSLADVRAAQDGIAPILAALVAPATRIVSLTITEKAYGLDRATRKLNPDDPQIALDLATPETPGSAIGLIVRALQLRKQAGHAPFTALCCDNLPDNGHLLRAAVLGFATRIDQGLATWIQDKVSFPILVWPKHRVLRSWALTSVPILRHATRPTRKASKFAITRSSMTL